MNREYNDSEQFDIKAIYAKLIAPSKPMFVKASEFFAPEKSALVRFQCEMDTYFEQNLIPLRPVITKNNRTPN